MMGSELWLCNILKEIMKEKGLNVADVARLCKLSDSTVRGIITRNQKSTALEVAFKLSKGLNVSLERLNGMTVIGEKEKTSTIWNNRIKERRNKLGISISEMAEKLNISEETAQKYENSDNNNIPYDYICDYAEILKCSPLYLMGWEKYSNEKYTALPIDINEHEMKVINEYHNQPDMQHAVDRLLGIERKLNK